MATSGTYTVKLERGGDTLTLSSDDLTSMNAPSEHSVQTSWAFTVPHEEGDADDPNSLAYYRHGGAKIYLQDEAGNQILDQRGPVDNIEFDDSSGTTKISGRNAFGHLEESGPSSGRIVADGPGPEEISRVWSLIDNWDAQVFEPTPRDVSDGRELQHLATAAQFASAIDFPDDLPYYVDSDNQHLTIHQTAFTTDTVDFTDISSFERTSGWDTAAASDGRYVALLTTSQSCSLSFSNEYTIPGDEFEIWVRQGLEDGALDNLDGQVDDYSINIEMDSRGVVGAITMNPDDEGSWRWADAALSGLDDVSPGTHSLDIYLTKDFDQITTDDPGWKIDPVAPLDDRWTYIFDNVVHTTGGYLDGPGLHGVELDPIAAEFANSDWNIESAEFVTEMANLQGASSLQMQLGSGNDWLPETSNPDHTDDGSTATSTETADFAENNQVGDTIRGRVELGANTETGPQGATPRYRYEPAKLDTWQINVDENTLGFFTGEVYRGNWFEIIQQMHRDAGMIFRYEPSPSTNENVNFKLVDKSAKTASDAADFALETTPDNSSDAEYLAESFEKGQLAGNPNWTVRSFNRKWDTRDYANAVTVVGTNDTDGQDPPTVEVTSSSEIDRVGEKISAYLPVDETNPNKLKNIARTELAKRIDEDEASGKLDVVPRRPRPGYNYYVEQFDTDAVLERVTFTDIENPTATLEFDELEDLTALVATVRAEANNGR